MNLRSRLSLALMFCAGVGASNAVMAGCPGVLTLPGREAAVTFGDGVAYSLPALGLSVQSSPGQIDDCIVVATGAGGTGVTTNFAGMNDAYATPNGTGGPPYFRTGDPTSAPDPGGGGPFVGDTPNTWDTRLSALSSYLAGNDMVVYFNHNQINSGASTNQDLFIWAQIALVDDAGLLPTLYFYVTSVPNSTGLQNFGAPGGDPLLYTGPQTPATCTYPTGPDSPCTFPHGGAGTGTGSGDATYMVRAFGRVCLNGPVGAGSPIPCDGSGGPVIASVNQNLGANEAADAIVFPEINAILRAGGFNGYDSLSADIRMGCNAATITGGTCVPGSVINNGYEQIFIGRLSPTQGPPGIPEPATLALVAVAMLGGAFSRRRKI